MAGSGFLLAARHYNHLALGLLAATLGGIALVIASACVFNNYIDRKLDEKMSRTSKRALVTQAISGPVALFYATLLGAAGFTVLTLFTDHRVVLLNLIAIVSYVAVYGAAKRKTIHGTLVGTIPGAIPPAAGYAAAAGKIDGGALILFLMMIAWQMPHFYAIALYRVRDYRAAGLPVMPVKHGSGATKIQVLIYIGVFCLIAAALTSFNYTGYTYLAGVEILTIYWFWLGLWHFKNDRGELWGRDMFRFSLAVLLGMSFLIPLGSILP